MTLPAQVNPACAVTPRQESPSLPVQYVGRDSVVKEGDVSSVDSKPELYLCEAFHCVQPYYWCEVRRSVLGVGQQRFCALSGQSGHLRNESAKPSCVCLCVREIQAVLQCGREDWAMAFVLSGQRSRRVKHSCPVDTKKKETHLQDENIAL